MEQTVQDQNKVEQLMRPRYRCITFYPQPPYKEDSDEHKFIEGDLLIQCNVNGALTFKRYGRLGHMSVGVPCCSHPEKYPKIFQKVEWWEERRSEELPQYVKWVPEVITEPEEEGEVMKVEGVRWNDVNKMWLIKITYKLRQQKIDELKARGIDKTHSTTDFFINSFEPATEADYLATQPSPQNQEK